MSSQFEAGAPTALSADLTASVVNPLIQSTIDAFGAMAGVSIKKYEVGLLEGKAPFHPITAVIQLSGQARGSVCVSLQRRTAFALVYRMLETRVTEVNDLVCDTVGEFANVIAGATRNAWDELDLQLGLPNIVLGTDCQIHFPGVATPMFVTFNSEIGQVKLVFGLSSRQQL